MCERVVVKRSLPQASPVHVPPNFLRSRTMSAPVTPGIVGHSLGQEPAISPEAVETCFVEVDVPSLTAGAYVVSLLREGRFKRVHYI